jgi:hypothetical protein
MDGMTLLRRAHEAGLNVAAEGDKLVIRGPRRAESVARLLIEYKPEVMAALTPSTAQRALEAAKPAAGVESVETSASPTSPGWWRNLFADRAAHHELGGRRPRAEAKRLAYGECIACWHQLFGKRRSTWQCAGCDQPIGGLSALTLSDANRVHFDTFDCLLHYSERWRGEAAVNLAKLGIDEPRDQEE